MNVPVAIGVDIGGTFTDLVLLDTQSGETFSGKTLTTPHDYSEGVLKGVRDLLDESGRAADQVELFVHGTTLVINAVIERKGARTAFLVTKGFRDVLRIRREMRYDIYDLDIALPAPLVRRSDTFEVDERIQASGQVFRDLDEPLTNEVLSRIGDDGYEAVAVCFLHSYRNPRHELDVESILGKLAPGAAISLSHRVLGQWREYDRASATVINAYTQPITLRYIDDLGARISDLGIRCAWYVMAANSGLISPDVAAEFPIRILESGPVGGALAAGHTAAERGVRNLLAFDMGGTTAKVSIVRDGVPLVTTDYEIARVQRLQKGSGLPVRLPVIDMIEIGAGGGSIGRIDELGLISVGPESAGADPGPACYGRGGRNATVTDANLSLGYLDGEYFLGGDMKLDPAAAQTALASLGAKLSMNAIETASAIHSIVTGNMAEAIRIHAVERDVDYRELELIAFGGAGPAHAYEMARTLGIRRVVFPRSAGVFSALGFLTAPLSFDLVTTYVTSLADADVGEVRSLFARMDTELRTLLARSKVAAEQIRLRRSVEMRYVGQGYEIEVDLPDVYLATGASAELARAFETAYVAKYGRVLPGAAMECVNWRSAATSPRRSTRIRPQRGATAGRKFKGERRVYLAERREFVECRVYDRYALEAGDVFKGPALFEERECTAFVGVQGSVHVDDHQNLLVEVAGAN